MHSLQTIVTDVHCVCLSVSRSVCCAAQLGFTVFESFGAVFAKPLWPLVNVWCRFILKADLRKVNTPQPPRPHLITDDGPE